jgi:hypothetical protein
VALEELKEQKMAEFDKDDYKFPDEIEETKGKPLEKDDSVDFEVEIEDDTPKDDRRRRNLPAEVVEEIEKDEFEQYSEDVKERLHTLKKAWHDERREKERVGREQQETVAATQRLLEENKKIKALLSNGEKEYVAAVKNSVEMELDKVKRDYREAYESGDTDRIIETQQKMNEAVLKLDRVNNFKMPPLQDNENEVQTSYQPPTPRPDDRVMRWQEQNPWFGQDEEMTASALGLHEKLKRNGVVIGSDEYYATINKTIRKRFPENFEEQEEVRETPRAKASTVVAPATRSTNAKKVKLTTSQVALAKKLGLTPEQYVKEVIKLEN